MARPWSGCPAAELPAGGVRQPIARTQHARVFQPPPDLRRVFGALLDAGILTPRSPRAHWRAGSIRCTGWARSMFSDTPAGAIENSLADLGALCVLCVRTASFGFIPIANSNTPAYCGGAQTRACSILESDHSPIGPPSLLAVGAIAPATLGKPGYSAGDFTAPAAIRRGRDGVMKLPARTWNGACIYPAGGLCSLPLPHHGVKRWD
jgi:hypothetical protein